MLEVPEGTHGLDIALSNGEGHVFRINPGDFFILGRTRFDCHGPEICDVQVNHFGIVTINVDGGTVTLELLPPALLRETDRTADSPNLAPRLAFGLSRSIRVPKSLPTFETHGSEGSRNVRSGTSADRDDKARITIRSDPSGPHGGRKYVVQTVNGDILTTGSADLDGDGTPDSGVRSVTPNALDDVGGFQGVELSHDRDFASVWSNRSDSSGDDWLAFGYWLRTPARVGMIGTAGTMWKSGPSTTDMMITRNHFNHLNALTGTATYTGPAAGLHAVDASVQAFTGSATLTADFDSPAYDPVGHVRSAYGYKGRLTGRIHDMMAAGASLPGEIMLQGYDNEADKSNIQPYYADADALLTFVDGEASMGDLSGKWSATFAGAGTSDPSGVVGVFGVTGRTPDGHVSFIGSFAAGKQ